MAEPNPPHPPKPGFSPMAAPSRRLATIASVDVPGWQKADGPRAEEQTITVRLTDGRELQRHVGITYDEGQRERIVEVSMDNTKSERERQKAWDELMMLRCRRDRLVERALGEMQREIAQQWSR